MKLAALLLLSALLRAQALEQAKRAFDRGDYAAALTLFEQARATVARLRHLVLHRPRAVPTESARAGADRIPVGRGVQSQAGRRAPGDGSRLRRAPQRRRSAARLRARAGPRRPEYRRALRRGEHLSEEQCERESDRVAGAASRGRAEGPRRPRRSRRPRMPLRAIASGRSGSSKRRCGSSRSMPPRWSDWAICG